MTFTPDQKKTKLSKTALVLACSALSTPSVSASALAQFSIMGAMDSRSSHTSRPVQAPTAPSVETLENNKDTVGHLLNNRPSLQRNTRTAPARPPSLRPVGTLDNNKDTLGHLLNNRPSLQRSSPTAPSRPSSVRPLGAIENNKDSLGYFLNNRPTLQTSSPVESPAEIPSSPVPSAQQQIETPTAAPVMTSGSQNKGGFSASEMDFNRTLGIVTARGDVEIIHDGQVLIADTVSYNQRSDVLTASGNVRIIQPNGDVLLSDYLEITSDLKNGTIKKIEMVLADRSRIQAPEATRSEGRFLKAKDATYSPCKTCEEDPESAPLWSLKAKEILHDQNLQRIEYSDVFLNIYDVPVFYVPYFHHPDPSKQRETGFLFPSFGSRSDIGSFVSTPFFVNLSPSHDLTLVPTLYYDESLPHLLAQYRQHFNNGYLNAEGSIVYADGGPGAVDQNEEDIRSHINADAQFNIDRTWRWGTTINAVSDDTYHRKYGIDSDDENGYLISDLYIEGFRGRNYINSNITGYQGLRNIERDDIQNAKAEILHSFVGQPSKTGAFLSNDLHFHVVTDEGNAQKTRLSADTTWELPYTSSGGEIYTLKTNLISAGYFTSNYNGVSNDPDYTGFQGRMVPSLEFMWQKPVSRSHANNLVNEVFEPVVNLKVAPNVGNNEKIPNEDSQDFEFDDTNLFKNNRFTGLDKIDGGQRVDYGLNWGAYGAGGGYTQLFVGQSYRLREDDTYDSNSGHEDNLSDVVGRVSASPSNFMDLLYRFRIDKETAGLNKSETSLSLGPASSRLSLSHLYVEGSGEDSEYGTREEIYGSLTNQWSKHWYSSIDARYRMNEPEGNISQGFEIGYRDECASFILDFRKDFFEDRDITPNEVFTLRFELKNLGEFSPF